jgi:hypothetical protein
MSEISKLINKIESLKREVCRKYPNINMCLNLKKGALVYEYGYSNPSILALVLQGLDESDLILINESFNSNAAKIAGYILKGETFVYIDYTDIGRDS